MPDAAHHLGSECRQCREPLEGRSRTARFCPNCGSALEPAETLPEAEREKLESSREQASAQLDALRSNPLEHVHSLMLLGYANAMLHLGWRYEQGRGVAQNSNEAERCYLKSAKLGNVFARARLTDERLADILRRESGHEADVAPIPVEPID